MAEEDIIQRLDRIIAIHQLVYRAELDAARESIRREDANAAILDLTADWTPTAKLQKAVAKKAGKSERTVRDKLAELTAQGLLEQRRDGRTIAYRSTGLI